MRDKCSMRKTVLSAVTVVGFVWTQSCFCVQTATAQTLKAAPEAGSTVSNQTGAISENKEKPSNQEQEEKHSNASTATTDFFPEGLAEPQEPQAEIDNIKPIYKYIGNSFSFKFHRPSCPFAKAMWRGHVIRFEYRKQAIDAGQKPCRYCLPPYWKSVGAKILKNAPESEQGLSTVENGQNLPTVNSPKKDVKSPEKNDYMGN